MNYEIQLEVANIISLFFLMILLCTIAQNDGPLMMIVIRKTTGLTGKDRAAAWCITPSGGKEAV